MKLKINIFIVLFVTLLSSVLLANVAQIYNRANNFYWNKDYISAIKDYRTIVNNYPTTHYADQALFSLGSCYFDLKDYSNAIVAYNKLLNEYQRSNLIDDVLYRLAEAYVEIGDYEKANNALVRIIQDYPNSLLVQQARLKLNSLPFERTPAVTEQREVELRRESELNRGQAVASAAGPSATGAAATASHSRSGQAELQTVTATAEFQTELSAQKKEFEEMLKIEEKKLADARSTIANLKDLLERTNRELDNHRSQLSEMKFLKEENEKFKKELLERDNTLAEFRKRLLAEAAQAKAAETKLKRDMETLQKSLETAKDLSQEDALKKTVERNNREIASLNFEIEKRDEEIENLKKTVNKLREQLDYAHDTTELEDIKKELMNSRRENIKLRADMAQMGETLTNSRRELSQLNRQLTELQSDTTPALLRAQVAQRDARINLLENTIEDYKKRVATTEDLQVLSQQEMVQQFNLIQNEIHELRARLQDAEKALAIQRSLSEREKENLQNQFTEQEQILRKRLETVTAMASEPAEQAPPTSEISETQMQLDSKSKVEEHIANAKELINQDNLSPAKLELLKALEIDENNPEIHNYLGIINYKKGDYLDEAIIHFEKAAELRPDNKGEYLKNIGKVYIKSKKFSQAIDTLKESVKYISQDDKKNLAEVHFSIGETFLQIGDNDKAFFEFFEVLKLVPETELALEARSILEKI